MTSDPHTHVQVHPYLYTQIHKYTHTLHIYKHVHIHIHTNVFTHTHTKIKSIRNLRFHKETESLTPELVEAKLTFLVSTEDCKDTNHYLV